MKPRFTAAQLAKRTLHRRAVEAIAWGIPAVNYDLMLHDEPVVVSRARGR